MSLVTSIEIVDFTIVLDLPIGQVKSQHHWDRIIDQLINLPGHGTKHFNGKDGFRMELDPNVTSVAQVKRATDAAIRRVQSWPMVDFSVFGSWQLQINFKRTLNKQQQNQVETNLSALSLKPLYWTMGSRGGYVMVESTQAPNKTLTKQIKHFFAR